MARDVVLPDAYGHIDERCDLARTVHAGRRLSGRYVDMLNQAFYADGNIATAGGCLASQYLAAWVIARFEGIEAAKSALHYVAPVGEKELYEDRAVANITPYLQAKPCYFMRDG